MIGEKKNARIKEWHQAPHKLSNRCLKTLIMPNPATMEITNYTLIFTYQNCTEKNYKT